MNITLGHTLPKPGHCCLLSQAGCLCQARLAAFVVPSAFWLLVASARSILSTCMRWWLLSAQAIRLMAAHCRTHYVPIHNEPEMWLEGSNLHEAWMWASQHPAEAAKVVHSARALSQLHFTWLGQTCYVVHLMHKSSKLVSD